MGKAASRRRFACARMPSTFPAVAPGRSREVTIQSRRSHNWSWCRSDDCRTTDSPRRQGAQYGRSRRSAFRPTLYVTVTTSDPDPSRFTAQAAGAESQAQRASGPVSRVLLPSRPARIGAALMADRRTPLVTRLRRRMIRRTGALAAPPLAAAAVEWSLLVMTAEPRASESRVRPAAGGVTETYEDHPGPGPGGRL